MAHEYRPPPMSLAQRAALRSQQPRVLRQPARRRIWPIVLILLLIALLVVAVGGFEYLYRDRVYPKVHLLTANLDVGGLAQDTIVTDLQPLYLQQSLRTIALIAPGHTPILVNATTLGYSLDRGQTAFRAYMVGRNGSYVQRARDQFNLLRQGANVALVQSVEGVRLRNYLFKLAPTVNRAARPGVEGRRLDVAPAQRAITHDLLHVIGAFKVYLSFVTIPALPAPHPATHVTKKHRAKAKKGR